MWIKVRLWHDRKAASSIVETAFEMWIDVRAEQFQKAASPIIPTEFGRWTEAREEQLLKAHLWIISTEFGIKIDAKEALSFFSKPSSFNDLGLPVKLRALEDLSIKY